MKRYSRLFQLLFFIFIVRPVVYLLLGLNIRTPSNLPRSGPLIIAANHNSHLDTVVIMSLFPLSQLHRVRPVAAADYWLKTKFLRWFSKHIINIVPIERQNDDRSLDILAPIETAVKEGDIVLLFPEGSRGEPEKLAEFKSGIAHLARRCPSTPVVPIFLRGLGKAMPKGDGLILPFFCDVYITPPIFWNGNKSAFMKRIVQRFENLANSPFEFKSS